MPPKDGKKDLSAHGRSKGKGGRKGGDRSTPARGTEAAKRISEMEGSSVEAESNIEILRAQRAVMRRGGTIARDTIRENEGIDEDQTMALDGGIRIEPFNMRREMAEGKFDEGGFYVLNKEEEKEVTDAWLDTVDQAERTATFKKEEVHKKANQTTASRLSAISRNLKEGGDDDEEEEEKEGEEEGDEEGSKKESSEFQKDPQPEETAEDAEDPADEISLLESLVSELLPLETVSAALARLAKAGSARSRAAAVSKEPPLKLRSRMRQARASAAQEQKPARVQESAEPQAAKPRKRKFNEFGYDDAMTDAAVSSTAEVSQAKTTSDEGAAKGGNPKELSDSETAEKLGSTSSVTNPSEVAAAAEKAASKEKADAEAAAAFAAEMKLTRHVLHAGVDGMGPELAAVLNLNADEGGTAKVALGAEQKEVEPDVGPGARRLKVADVADSERKKKIERLTDLCDSLLQKGVNVYESSRELLAIEVRERKGEKLRDDEAMGESEDAQQAQDETGKQSKDGASSEEPSAKENAATKQADSPANGQKPAVAYVNSRCVQSEGQSAVVDAEAFVGTTRADDQLLWQLRWLATPDDIHGPFDSVTMQGWMTQGCFAEERPAEIRQCNAKNEPMETCWHSWDKMDFELYL